MTERMPQAAVRPRALPGRVLWAAYEYLSMLLGLGMFAALCLLWLPCALLLRLLLPARWGRPLARRAHMLGFRGYLGFLTFFCGFRFDLAELDRLRDEGALILVANHPSLLDAVMIVSRLPNAVCIMKAALLNNILFGAAARLACYIRNDGPLEMLLRARHELARGTQLVLFPEGTRTSAFPVSACSASAGLIAKASAVPVQTALIECSAPYLGKTWPLLRRPPLPLHFRIRLGERFDPPQDVTAFTAHLEQYFRNHLKLGN